MNKDKIELYSADNIWGDQSIDLLFRNKIQKRRSDIGLKGYSICKDDDVALKYFEIEAIVDELAKQLLYSGLNSGDILAVQLPNSVETQLLYLACWQQNIIIAAMPSLWRKRDVEQALIRVSPQGYICAKIHDGFNFDELMYETAFNISTIRQLFTLGGTPSDGCIALDNCFEVDLKNDLNLLKPTDYPSNDSNAVCFISFAKDDSGVNMPYHHTHNHLIAASRLPLSLVNKSTGSNLINPFGATSLVVLATGLITWILSDYSFTCKDGLIATEFQNLELQNSILVLPQSFDEPNLVAALFEQKLHHLILLGKIQTKFVTNTKNPQIIDIISVDEFAFIPVKRTQSSSELLPQLFEFSNDDQNGFDRIELSITEGIWQVNCSFLPLYCGEVATSFDTKIPNISNSTDPKSIVGCMSVDFVEIEHALMDYPGVEDVAVLNFDHSLMASKPVIAIVPKIGAIILQHEVVQYLKDKKIANYKIPDELFKIPEIARNFDNQIIRSTSRESLLDKIGPNKSGASDGLIAVQQELASLLNSV